MDMLYRIVSPLLHLSDNKPQACHLDILLLQPTDEDIAAYKEDTGVSVMFVTL